MTLETLGWNSSWEASFAEWRDQGLEPGRIATEDKHLFHVLTENGELSGQVSGKFLYRAATAADLPKVGDWVAVSLLPNEAKAVIHHLLPRRTKLSRKAPGRVTEEQVLATNLDIVFIVQGLDRSVNPALLQRHLVMVLEGGIKPVVVLNKADLCVDLQERMSVAETAAGETPVIAASARTGQAIEALAQRIRPGETVAFIGASGVGKSSLINQLCGEEILATAEVRARDAKGRHTTAWRELIALPRGGLVIDTPGMREFHLWTAGEGLPEAFSEIEALAAHCHFRDCTHSVEKDCAVQAAVAAGQLTAERCQNFLKLERELRHLEAAHRNHDRLEQKRRTKAAQRAFNRFNRHGQA